MSNIPGFILLIYVILGVFAAVVLLRGAILELRKGGKVTFQDIALFIIFSAGIGTVLGFGFRVLSFILWWIFGRE